MGRGFGYCITDFLKTAQKSFKIPLHFRTSTLYLPRTTIAVDIWSCKVVTYTESQTFQELQAEVARLQDELQMRDGLVQQLSQELFRLVKGNPNVMPSPEASEKHQAEVRALRQQLQGVEQQVSFYQEQLAERDREMSQLNVTSHELTDRCRMLEQVVQELPTLYRQKFAERMTPVKEKIASLQKENRQLQAELQSVSYRLAVKSRRDTNLDLPSFPRSGIALPSLSNA
jgi:chromosome segregation ATPase